MTTDKTPATLATVKHGGCVQLEQKARDHRWNDVGERCLDCGDKDWMGGACSGPRATACAGPWLTITNAPNDGQQHIRGLWVTSRIDGKPDTREWRQYIGLVNDGGEFVDPEYGETFGWEADEYEAWMPAAEAPGAALSAQPQYITDAYELGMRDGQNLSAQPSPGGQGALVDTARRNIRQFISRASFSSSVDKQAALSCVDVLEAALAARQPVGHSDTFQHSVSEWMDKCFLPSLYSNMTERGDRLLEEVLELLQAHGYNKARVPTLVDYVFDRPVGEPAQEVGGVMVTLAGYCWVAGLDMHAAGDAELARINQPEVMDKIRQKQEAKNALHLDTPLPGHAAPTAQTVDLGAERMFYIQDTRQFVGNCPMWWGPNGSGYVTRLDEAGRYTEQEAIKQNRTRDTDIPWPCAEIDAIARRTVDGQHMRPRAERLAELALVDSQAVGNG